MSTTVERGASRHVAAAVASALFRLLNSPVSDAQIEDETTTVFTANDDVEDELDLRLAAIRPVLRAKVVAREADKPPCIAGSSAPRATSPNITSWDQVRQQHAKC